MRLKLRELWLYLTPPTSTIHCLVQNFPYTGPTAPGPPNITVPRHKPDNHKPGWDVGMVGDCSVSGCR